MNAEGDIPPGVSASFSGEPTNALSVVDVDVSCILPAVDWSLSGSANANAFGTSRLAVTSSFPAGNICRLAFLPPALVLGTSSGVDSGDALTTSFEDFWLPSETRRDDVTACGWEDASCFLLVVTCSPSVTGTEETTVGEFSVEAPLGLSSNLRPSQE